MESNNDSSLGVIGIMRERESNWEHCPDNLGTSCKVCRQNTFGNCFLSCERCGQECHIFCAYISGFDLKLL